jgi:hypothetical protein
MEEKISKDNVEVASVTAAGYKVYNAEMLQAIIERL